MGVRLLAPELGDVGAEVYTPWLVLSHDARCQTRSKVYRKQHDSLVLWAICVKLDVLSVQRLERLTKDDARDSAQLQVDAEDEANLAELLRACCHGIAVGGRGSRKVGGKGGRGDWYVGRAWCKGRR